MNEQLHLTCPACQRQQIDTATCPNCETDLSALRILAALPPVAPSRFDYRWLLLLVTSVILGLIIAKIS
jgi:hypothetical protein